MATSIQFPRIYLLPTHLAAEEYSHLRNSVPSLTDDINEADLVVGKIARGKRAEFELRRHKVDIRPGCEAGGFQKTGSLVQVVKLSWLTDCLAQERLLPYDEYLLFRGSKAEEEGPPSEILQRALGDKTGSSYRSAVPPLLHQTTSEHEMDVPEIPDFLRTPYSCQRPTLMDPPNGEFIQELKRIRTFRLLQGDKIGVRAYSTSIAALAAYPRAIQSLAEIELLPGCSVKTVELYQQWLKDGCCAETSLAAEDQRLSVLKLFYDIWGVGDTTAREFYNKGYRDLDDIAEHGWHSLSRVQQIGVKYYDDFKRTIPRHEVEDIAALILSHARSIDPAFEMAIVGGYRRGKEQSGDVDVVLSHREEAKTMYMVEKLVLSLESADLITHTLSLSTNNSGRGQRPLSWRGEVPSRGSGFDTLDKAMVVWQNKAGELHRRVDIIVSPWKTVGCALLGWSGETTFQRDLRLYCKQEKGLKFDSSGIRRRSDGEWMDFEGSRAARRHMVVGAGDYSAAPDMEAAEKRVFDGLHLQWRPPAERCTG